MAYFEIFAKNHNHAATVTTSLYSRIVQGTQHVSRPNAKENTKDCRSVVSMESMDAVLEKLWGWRHATDKTLR